MSQLFSTEETTVASCTSNHQVLGTLPMWVSHSWEMLWVTSHCAIKMLLRPHRIQCQGWVHSQGRARQHGSMQWKWILSSQQLWDISPLWSQLRKLDGYACVAGVAERSQGQYKEKVDHEIPGHKTGSSFSVSRERPEDRAWFNFHKHLLTNCNYYPM